MNNNNKPKFNDRWIEFALIVGTLLIILLGAATFFNRAVQYEKAEPKIETKSEITVLSLSNIV